MRSILSLSIALILAGCAGGLPFRREAPQPSVAVVMDPDEAVARPQARPGAGATSPLRAQGRSADTLDTTTPAERAAATAPRQGGQALGETLAGLGSPTEPGFWLQTGLVQNARPGRVEIPGGGSVSLELRPSGAAPGAGSQISLAALRALEVPLTQLVSLRVFAE